MHTRAFLPLVLLASLARADLLPPAQDSSSLKGKLTPVTGKAGTLAVTATRKGYVLFNLENLPPDVQASEIANARLRVYFPSVLKAGNVAVYTVAASWDEKSTALEPAISGSPVEAFLAASVVAKKFAEVDVTTTVQGWLTNPSTNFGFAFVASGLTNVTLGAKEGSGSGYPCELEVEIERAGSIDPSQLGDGTITNAKLANSTIMLTAGAGLSGGSTVALGGTVTLNNTGVLSLAGGGGITVSGSTGAITLGSNATNANVAGTLVLRDGSGAFSAGALDLPATSGAGLGLITQNSTPLIHTFGTANFFAGLGAGNLTMSGMQNTASGFQALAANTTGSFNTASGLRALYSNTSGSINTAIGLQVLYSNTTGSINTATGVNAMFFNTTACRNVAVGNNALYTQSYDNNGVAWNSDNVALGFEALYANQPTSALNGYENTAVGTQAMRSNTTGAQNTANGFQALYFNATGSGNTASGYAALAFNVDGFSNTATGWEALFSNTSGYQNTASGYQSLLANTTASRNVAVGNFALAGQTFSNGGVAWDSENVAVGVEALYFNQPTTILNGRQNSALGTQAMRSNRTGSQNTASGYQALYTNGAGGLNTASGWGALYFNTDGASNAAFGASALYNSTGSGNTGFGTSALINNTTGSNNTAIGYAANVNGGNLTNATAVGYGATVNASNKVRIGNSDVTVIEGQVALTYPSDRNLKENFRPVDGAEVLRKIRGFELTSWNYKGQDETTLRHYGPMAQDFFAAFGHDEVGAIGTDKTINSGDAAGILFSAIQALANENAALKEQLAERDARDREREARLARLEKLLPTAAAAQ